MLGFGKIGYGEHDSITLGSSGADRVHVRIE
jgi:hypothetical protein